MTYNDELGRAVERLEKRRDAWSLNADSARVNVRLGDLRLILTALRKQGEALERIADHRNIHFAGDAQVVANEALKSSPNTQAREGEG